MKDQPLVGPRDSAVVDLPLCSPLASWEEEMLPSLNFPRPRRVWPLERCLPSPRPRGLCSARRGARPRVLGSSRFLFPPAPDKCRCEQLCLVRFKAKLCCNRLRANDYKLKLICVIFLVQCNPWIPFKFLLCCFLLGCPVCLGHENWKISWGLGIPVCWVTLWAVVSLEGCVPVLLFFLMSSFFFFAVLLV